MPVSVYLVTYNKSSDTISGQNVSIQNDVSLHGLEVNFISLMFVLMAILTLLFYLERPVLHAFCS